MDDLTPEEKDQLIKDLIYYKAISQKFVPFNEMIKIVSHNNNERGNRLREAIHFSVEALGSHAGLLNVVDHAIEMVRKSK